MKIRFGDYLYIKGRIGWQSLKKDEYLKTGDYYLVTGVDINDNQRIDFDSCYFVSKERYDLDPFIQLKVGDIILTKDGTIGKIGYIDRLDKPATLNSHLFLIRSKQPKVLDPLYLFYLLQSKRFMKYAAGNTTGSNVPAFTQKNISDYEVEIPSIDEQKKIAKILYDLDSKVINNASTEKCLRKTISELYDYWFVQFDFPDKNGRPYKSSGGKMKYDSILKRDIPEEWTNTNLYKNGFSKLILPGVDFFEKKNYLATKNVDGHIIKDGDWINYENRESRANMQPIFDSLWFAKMKNSVKHIAVTESDEWFTNKYILSTGFCGIECFKNSFSYLYAYIESDIFEFLKDRLSHGATQEAVNNDDLKGMKIPYPSAKVLEQFDCLVKPMIKKINVLIRESKELGDQRNYLMPLLLGGVLKIR